MPRPKTVCAHSTVAVAAQAEWAATPPRKRGEILRSVFERFTDRADDFATLDDPGDGQGARRGTGEVNYGAEFFRWFAEEAVRIDGRYRHRARGHRTHHRDQAARRSVLAITPWNFPLAMGTRKIGPAFAAGCTMIVKPAQETPLTMLLLAKLMDEAGLPEGRAVGPADHARSGASPTR